MELFVSIFTHDGTEMVYAFRVRGCLFVCLCVQINVAVYFQNGLTDLHTVFCKGFVIHWGWFLHKRYGLKSPGALQ